MKKLLVLSPVGGTNNGADISMKHQMEYLCRLGYKVVYVYRDSIDRDFEYFLEKNEIEYEHFPYSWWFDSELFKKEANKQDTIAIAKMIQLIQSKEIDLAITNTANIPWLATAAAICQIPHLWLVHEFFEGEFDYIREKYDFIVAFSNEILASSKVLANSLKRLDTFANVGFFNPYTDVSNIHIKKEELPPRLVSVNHISARKNSLELIYIFERLKMKNPKLQLIFTGKVLEQAYFEKLKSYIQEHQVEDVEFLENGDANFEDVNKNDIFVNTSSAETFGLTTIEALKLGIVTVATNTAIVALREFHYFDDTDIYQLGDTQEATDKIQAKLNDFEQSKNRARLIQEKVIKEQAIEKISQTIVEAIEKYDASPRSELRIFENFLPTLEISILENEVLKKEHKQDTAIIKELKRRIEERETKIDELYRSSIWKIGRIVTYPLRLVKRELQMMKASRKKAYPEWILRNEGRTERLSFLPSKTLVVKELNDDFFYILDKDTMIAEGALSTIKEYLNEQVNLLYFDSDEVVNDKRVYPYFKPDYSPDLLLNTNYFGSFVVFRKDILPLPDETVNLYDFLLKFTETIDKQSICHIPKVLSHRKFENLLDENQFEPVKEALARRNIRAEIKEQRRSLDIAYAIENEELVSIVIPTRNGYGDLKQCIDSIIEKTTYTNYEIIVADNQSDDTRMEELYESYEKTLGRKFKKLAINIPFNYSRINNLAVEHAQGKYILLLNNDTSVIEPGWLSRMVGLCQFDRIGCVGAKLIYPDDTIQHAGVVLGHGGTAGHAFLFKEKEASGYRNFLQMDYNYSAVTAACLLVKKEDYTAVGGLDEEFEVAYNDIDFCLRVKALGKDNVLAHKAMLYHSESKSRGLENTLEKQARFQAEVDKMQLRWSDYIEKDPAYNPNFTRLNASFEIDNPNSFAYERPLYRRVGSLAKRVLRKVRAVGRENYYRLKSSSLRKKRDKERNNCFDNTLLIYVIYNESGAVDPYKLAFYHSMEKYAQKIRVVVNGSLEPKDYDELNKSAEVLIRENTGYDAAGFRAGILSFSKEELKQFDRLLLINDTNIGPIYDFDQVFEKMNPRQHDFWGLLYGQESIDPTGLNPFGYFPRHIQTYFLVVERSMLHSEDFYGFYEKMPNTNTRNMAIACYETYLTKYFEDRGYRSSVYVESKEYGDLYQYPLTLIRDFEFPIIKKASLLYYNDALMEEIRGAGTHSEVSELLEYFSTRNKEIYGFLKAALDEYKNK